MVALQVIFSTLTVSASERVGYRVECRFQRDVSRPCNGVESYDEADDGYESPDEVPLGLRREIVENLFGEI
jgi:hypothetical protein